MRKSRTEKGNFISVNLIWEIELATAIKCNKTEGTH